MNAYLAKVNLYPENKNLLEEESKFLVSKEIDVRCLTDGISKKVSDSLQIGDDVYLWLNETKRVKASINGMGLYGLGKVTGLYENSYEVSIERKVKKPCVSRDIEFSSVPLCRKIYEYTHQQITDLTDNDAIQFFEDFLDKDNIQDTSEVIEELLDFDSEEDARKKVDRAIAIREGQPKFRNQLMSCFERCVVTGCEIKACLEAAHIVPYNGKSTNILANGLLMRSDIHTLYDKDLIMIDGNGRIHLNEALRKDDYYRPFENKIIADGKDLSDWKMALQKRFEKTHN
jgi:hypothetical protein